MILFPCECGEELEAAEHEAGRMLMCPICHRKVSVPRPEGNQEGIVVADAPRAAGAWWELRTSPGDVAEPSGPQALPTSQAALASLVLGLLSIVLSILAGIPAIIAGVVGLRSIRRSEGQLAGKGIAIAGITLGFVTSLLAVSLVPVVQWVRRGAEETQSRNNLKQIALAIQSYQDTYNAFPQQAIYSKDGVPLLSLRVMILPYIEQNALYKQFNLEEPWDSPHNMALLSAMPDIYKRPGRPELDADFATLYQGFVGKNTFLRSSPLEKLTQKDFRGEAGGTLMVVEARHGVPWSKPEDLTYDPAQPLPALGAHEGQGFIAARADGTTTFFDADTSEKSLRNAIAVDIKAPPGAD